MSQEELARLSGLHTTWVAQLDRGEVSPSLPTLIALADALRIPPAALLAGLGKHSA